MRRTLTALAGAAALVVCTTGAARAQTQTGRDFDDTHRALQIATSSTLVVTATLGTIIAMNKPTLFGEGRCAEGDPIFGEYGCHGLSVVHGLFAIGSLILYTATQTLEFAEYDWPGQQEHGTGFDVASGLHLVGMGLLPIFGLMTVVPEMLGIDGQAKKDFQKVMRTLHLIGAYTVVGTYLTTVAIDF